MVVTLVEAVQLGHVFPVSQRPFKLHTIGEVDAVFFGCIHRNSETK